MNTNDVIQLQSKRPNRITEIDIAKGLGIILVVYAHIILAEPVLTIIYSFHMPLFFMLSGMVTNVDKFASFSDFVKNKFRKMLVPYLFFCLLAVVSVVFLKMINFFLLHETWSNAGEFFLKSIYSIVWAPYSLKYFTKFNTPMWFVPCLLLVEAMYYFVSRVCKKHAGGVKYVIILIITTVGWVMESEKIPIDFSVLPWNFSSACFSLGFFAFGDLFKKYIFSQLLSDEKKESTKTRCLLILVVSACITILIGLLNGKVSIGSRILHNGFLFYISGVCGTLFIICISRLLRKCNLLKFMGQNSFTIMGCHLIIYRYIPYLFAVLNKVGIGFIISPIKNCGATWWTVFEFVVTLLLSLLFTNIYNYFLSKIRSAQNGRTA